MKSRSLEIIFVLFLVILGIFSRVIPHPWNFTAIGAMALFSAFSIRTNKYLLLVPFLSLAISDLYLMQYSGQIFVYSGFAVGIALSLVYFTKQENLGWKNRVISLAGLSVVSSFLFFLITNFGAWKGSDMYTQDFSGLMNSYFLGLPFLRNQIAGDMFYGAIVFGLYAYMTSAAKETVVSKN